MGGGGVIVAVAVATIGSMGAPDGAEVVSPVGSVLLGKAEQNSPKLSPNSVTLRSTSLMPNEMGPPRAVKFPSWSAGTTASNWTPVGGTGLGSVTLKGMSKKSGNPPGNGGPGNGTGMTGPPGLGFPDIDVVVVVVVAAPTVVDDDPEDDAEVVPKTATGPGKSATPVVSMNIAASPVIWVRPRPSACCATAWGIENCVWSPASWNCWPWASVDGVIVAVVVVSLSTRSPTGLPGQYIS